MLSQTMLDKLNDQITLEFYSSNFYLQMSSWCQTKGLGGCGSFMLRHSQEEMAHMLRLFNYVNDTGAQAIIGEVAKPRHDFGDVREVFLLTLEHERFVTTKINELVGTAFQERDFSSFSFLQWHVAEQHEEEKLFLGLVDKIDLIGMEGRGVFFFDQEVGQMAKGMAQPNPLIDAQGAG